MCAVSNPARCIVCMRAFYKWVETHTSGRGKRARRNGVSFYVAAAKFIGADKRRITS